MNRMYSLVALLFFITAASLSSHANAVELEAFSCTDLAVEKDNYKQNESVTICVNPAGDYADNYKITTLKDVTCKGPYRGEDEVSVIRGGGDGVNGQVSLDSEHLNGFKGRDRKQAAPNGMGFKMKAYEQFLNQRDRQLACQGTAEVEYTEPCKQQTYTFPTSKSDSEVYNTILHGGFCVIGARDATTSVSRNGATYADFTYENVSGLADGTKVWGDKNNEFAQLEGNICEDGIFLQSPKKFGLPLGVDVTIETTEEDGESDGVTICAIVEPPFFVNGRYHNLGGEWMQQLLEQGFEPKGEISYSSKRKRQGRLRVLCKLISEPCEDNSRRGRGLAAITELNFEADVDIGDGCPDDIAVIRTDGVTPYPQGDLIDPPVSIISQGTTNVTVEVKNSWDKLIGKFYYSYMKNAFSKECFSKDNFCLYQAIGPFTIQCNVLTPFAFLRICLEDFDLLVEGDNAEVSPCCQTDAETGSRPMVCYNLEIKCENSCIEEESCRNLRTIAA